jgi:hypothetical protein
MLLILLLMEEESFIMGISSELYVYGFKVRLLLSRGGWSYVRT